MRCPACGAGNPDGASACQWCGASLDVSLADLAADPGAAVGSPVAGDAADRRPCDVCGEVNVPGARFCVSCGTALGPPASAAATAGAAADIGGSVAPEPEPVPGRGDADDPTTVLDDPTTVLDDPTTVLGPAPGPDAGTDDAAATTVMGATRSPHVEAELPEAYVDDDDEGPNVRALVLGATVVVLVLALVLVGWSQIVRDDADDAMLPSIELPDVTPPPEPPPPVVTPDEPPPTPAPTSPPTSPPPVTSAPTQTAPAETAPPETGPSGTGPSGTEPSATEPGTSPATTPPSTVPPTPAPTTAPAPTTTASPAPPPTLTPGGVPGDLGVPGRPMSRPPCDGGHITIVQSASGPNVSAAGVGSVLEEYPDTEYLRTDQTCPSLRQQVDGNPVYVVYFGPYSAPENACADRSRGPADSYVRTLSTDLPPNHTVDCPS